MAIAELRCLIAVELQCFGQRCLVLVRMLLLLLPGAEVAISVIAPMPTEWCLRPVSSAARVGEHTAVL